MQAGDREQRREQEEPASLADDVKHGRGPVRAPRPGGPGQELLVADAAQLGPPRQVLADDDPRGSSGSRSMAVNIEVSTPMIRTSAKPLIVERAERSTGCRP